jgi:hypothetical protein
VADEENTQKAPAVRLLLAIVGDVRNALIALAVGASVAIANWVVHGHVDVPAWALVTAAGAVVVALLLLDAARHRAVMSHEAQRERHTGALAGARLRGQQAEAARRLSPAAEELLASLKSLRATIEARALPYTTPEYVDAGSDLEARLKRLMSRSRTYLSPIPRDLHETLLGLEQAKTLGGYLSALAELEPALRAAGRRDQSDDPPPPAGWDFAILDP